MDKQVTMVDYSSVPLFRAFCCQAQVSKTGQELAVPVVPDSTEMEKGGEGRKPNIYKPTYMDQLKN